MKTSELAELIKSAKIECETDGHSIAGIRSLAHNLNYSLANARPKHNERKFLQKCGF